MYGAIMHVKLTLDAREADTFNAISSCHASYLAFGLVHTAQLEELTFGNTKEKEK